MRLVTILTGMGMALICASANSAESQTAPTTWIVDTTVIPGAAPPATVAELLIQLDHSQSFDTPEAGGFEAAVGLIEPAAGGEPRVIDRRDVWFETAGFSDRMRLRTEGALRRADGAPVPVSPLDPAALEAEHFDLSYIRGWPATLGYTASGLEVTLISHAGYNFARTRDGDFARSGVSHDTSSFIGDASLGVAYRKGDVQSSIGLIYRELGPSDLRAGHGVDTDVSEGLLAFQLSIKPDW